jgi:hypothetical protein
VRFRQFDSLRAFIAEARLSEVEAVFGCAGFRRVGIFDRGVSAAVRCEKQCFEKKQ